MRNSLLILAAALVTLLLLTACIPPTLPDGNDPNTGANGDVADNNEPAGDSDDDLDDDDGSDDDGSDDGGTDDASAGVRLSGKLAPAQAAKRRPGVQPGSYPFTIVAQSDATGELYRAETDETGQFVLDLPADEEGHAFTVTILGPDGRALGPVLFGVEGDTGFTGLALERDADLGTMDLPDDPAAAPILPGSEADIADLVDSGVAAVLNAKGVPAGLDTFGKGAGAGIADASSQTSDADRDGLIEIFDADDDADGIVDDFDGGGDTGGALPDCRVNFFMNLKIAAEAAATFYSGSDTDIEEQLKTQTVITLEAMTEPGAPRAITAVHLLETPGPAYLPLATMTGGGGSSVLWSESGYAFNEQADRFDVFIVPNALMAAGDSFTAEIEFDDGTTEQYTRMLNYVFTNIPRLLRYGPPGNLVDFDVADAAINGSPSHPIPVDNSEDLVLEFEPPPDESGAPLTDMWYTFQCMYYGDGGRQLDVDMDATFGTLPPGVDANRPTYTVSAADLGDISIDGLYTVTLPKELFVETVTETDGSVVAVTAMKIDVTAECTSGNAAIMLSFTVE